MQYKITPLNPQNRHHLRRLNVAWLKKYFYVEPNDIIQLQNPEIEIIAKGGFVFFALLDKEVVGTITLMKKSDSCFELSKMAVDENFQGKGIGQELMNFVIDFAKQQNATELILYTNSILKTAISIYEKNGFINVEMDNTSYKRSNVKMERTLV